MLVILQSRTGKRAALSFRVARRLSGSGKLAWLLLFLTGWPALYAQTSMNPQTGNRQTPPARKGFTLAFNEDFSGSELDTLRWIPYYLPQWSSREQSKPRYRLEGGHLRLQITPDQPPWCPEFNGNVRCSSLQTGLYAGPVGSPIGQHRINPACVVRQAQSTQRKYVPLYGYVEIRARWAAGPSNVAALWMIGFEDKPERSAELCVVEIKGENVGPERTVIGYGMHKFADTTLREAFYEEPFPLDVGAFHVYAVEWLPHQVTFLIDDKPIRVINQSPAYPMQLMLGLYDVPNKTATKSVRWATPEFVVDYVRGYSLH